MNKKEQRAADKVAKAAVTPVVDAILEAQNAPMPIPGIGKDGKALKVKKAKVARADGLVDLPKLPRTRKPKTPKDCGCGCGGSTKGGRFIPGHDARLHGWARRVEIGLIELKDIPHEGERAAVKAHMAAATKAKA